MVWKQVDVDNKVRYIKGRGDFFHLSKNSDGALDSIPDGWKVIRRSGRLKLLRDR